MTAAIVGGVGVARGLDDRAVGDLRARGSRDAHPQQDIAARVGRQWPGAAAGHILPLSRAAPAGARRRDEAQRGSNGLFGAGGIENLQPQSGASYP